MTNITYGEAIAYLANNGFIYKAIYDLSQCAQVYVSDMEKRVDELNAEKRTVKKFLKSNMDAECMVEAIGALVSEEESWAESDDGRKVKGTT